MRVEIINGQRVEYADDNKWLYKDSDEERHFAKCVYLGKEAPIWAECTNDEKISWEQDHSVPEPETTE